MSFKIKNAQAMVAPVTQTVMILGQAFPKLPYLLNGETLDFLRIRREKLSGERMGLVMFAAFCAYRLTPEQRMLEFQVVNETTDTVEIAQFDLGNLEQLERLPLTADELAEMVTGSLKLLNAGMGVKSSDDFETKAATEEGKSESLTLVDTSPSSPISTASILETSLTSPGPQPSNSSMTSDTSS